jgi:hypothetical protein
MYASYLIFCEQGNDLTDNDRRFLADHGFELRVCTDAPPAPLPRLIVADAATKLIIYEARTEQSDRDPRARLRLAPSQLSEATEADDVVLPWNRVLTRSIGGRECCLAGLSMPRRTWLREYFRDPALSFDYEADPFQGRLASASPTATELGWPLRSGGTVSLPIAQLPREASADAPAATVSSTGEPADGAPKHGPEIVAVPANLLAWVSAEAAGLIDYDADVRRFVPRIEPAVYDRARLYAATIDDVPRVVRALAEHQFAVMSETGRITEIHRQDESLQLLVYVVGCGVFLFGVVTVFSVLMDSTDRKRATIGILRVMGMSRAGIFISILLRATAIGAAAAALSLLCGHGLSAALEWRPPSQLAWLAWKPLVAVQLAHADLFVVAAGAMLCCCLGAIPPAWKASRLDPFDAIVEGRFR